MPPPVNAPEDFARVILKACAYEPADRFPDAKSMRLALESIISGDEDALKLYLENLPDPEKATVTIIGDNKTTAGKPAGKRKPLIIGAAAAVVFAVIVAVGALSNGMSGSDDTAAIDVLAGDSVKMIVDPVGDAASSTEAEQKDESGNSGELTFPDFEGATVTVTNASELKQAVNSASAGTTIELESGDYDLGDPLIIHNSGIRLLGKGDSKPILDSMIQLDSANVMIENISISVSKEDNTKTTEETENSGILCQGGNAYIKDTDIRLSYPSENNKVGITVYSPVTMSGCTVDVTSSEGNGHTGIFANTKLYAKGNVINAGNGVGIDVYSGSSGMSEEELKTIAADNTINAYTKISVQNALSF